MNGFLQRDLKHPCRLNYSAGKGVIIKHTAVIEEGCAIGDEVFIGHYCILRPNTIIGDRTKVGHLTVIEGWASIGKDCFIAAQSNITKGMIIEDKVFIGMGVMSGNDRRMVHLRRDKAPFISEPPIVRYGARIGMGAILLPGCDVGREAFVAAGSIVHGKVYPYTTYVGNTLEKHTESVPDKELLSC